MDIEILSKEYLNNFICAYLQLLFLNIFSNLT